MTALKIAEDAEAGADVCGLSMFDQGYYDKMGFGTGNYTHSITFPLKALKLSGKPKVPKRLSEKDITSINESINNRMRAHGSFACTPDLVKGMLAEGGTGFGYFNNNGKLTHHIWFENNGESGPLDIYWWTYQNHEQLKELLVLLKSFEDQIISVKTIDLPFLNIQDLLERPFHHKSMADKSKHQYKVVANAAWQMRILDLENCIAKTNLFNGDLEFNLNLKDPIKKYLINEDVKWKGIDGEYIIKLGQKSSAVKGVNPNLPSLKASVGAFTRMWLGCEKASILSFSDELNGEEDLIKELDKIFCLPLPMPDHPF